MTPFEYVTPDRLDCHTAHKIAAIAARNGWHAVGFRGLASSDDPARVDETLELHSPDRDVEIWLMMHDVDGDGRADNIWWRQVGPGRPSVDRLELLCDLIDELGVIDLRTAS